MRERSEEFIFYLVSSFCFGASETFAFQQFRLLLFSIFPFRYIDRDSHHPDRNSLVVMNQRISDESWKSRSVLPAQKQLAGPALSFRQLSKDLFGLLE